MTRLAVLVCALALAVVTAAAAAGLSIVDGPSGPTTDPTPTFAWTPDTGASCSIDGADPKACTSPLTLDELDDGAHAFEVEVGGERAARSFTVDTVAPVVELADGAVADSRATFVFTAEPGADTGCAVDGTDYEPCTSPFTTRDLPNGGHVVRVRAVDAAGNVGDAARLAQIDVAPPETTITAGPEGDVQEAQPEFSFASSRQRSTFRCQIDATPLVDCGSSFAPAAPLANGAHTLKVAAVDAAGNVDASPAERAFTVVACQPSVAFGALAISGKCLQPVGATFVSTGPVKINGLTFTPRGNERIVIDPAARKVSLGDVQLRMGSVVLFQGDLSFAVPEGKAFRLARIDTDTKTRLDAPAEGVDTEAALDLEGDDSAQVAGFPLKGEAALDLVEGQSILSGNIELPRVFADAEGRGLTGSVQLKADNERGLRLDEAKVTAPLAFVGQLELHDLFVSFAEDASGVGGANTTCNTETPGLRWEGGATAIVLPTPGRLRLEEVGVGFADGALSHAEAAWKPTTEGGASLGGGVKIQKLAVSLCAGPPLTLAGRAGLTAVPGPDGKPRLEIPSAGLIFKGGDPWSIRVEAPAATFKAGTVPITFSDVFVDVSSAGAVDFGGRAKFSVDVKGDTPAGKLDAAVAIDAGVKGFVDGSRFNADFDATGCFGGTFTIVDTIPASFSDLCAKVEGVVSSVGAAVCGELKVKDTKVGRVGAGLTWGGPLKFMAGACDVGPWRVQKPAASTSAVTAAAGRRLDLPASERGVMVAVRGVGAAPRVELRGPFGARIESAADATGTVATGTGVAFSNVAQKTTYVVLRRPPAGAWTVTAAGGARIADVRSAALLAPVEVAARVSGHGRARVLRYRVPRRAGQRVVFVERGRRVSRTLTTVRGGGRARVPFRAADGPGGKRRIEAVVEQDGAPRDRLVVAHFTAPRRARPAHPRGVRIARGTRTADVAWDRTARAARYGVRVSVSDGRELFFVRDGGDRRVRVPGVGRTRRVAVRVVGLRADNSHGRASTATSRRTK